MPSCPATSGELAIVSFGTSLRNWARGLLRPVVVVLPGDPGQHLLQLVRVDAVLLRVGGGEQAELRGRGGVALPVVPSPGGAGADQAGEAGVLQLLDPDRHRAVVGAAGHRVAGVAQRLRSGRAHVLQPGHRLVGEPERPGRASARTCRSPSCRARTRRCRPARRRRGRRRRGRSTSRSSADLSQCSPKAVQPIPTMATRSLMPCDAHVTHPSRLLGADRPRLPEVVVDAGGGDQPPEGHLDPAAVRTSSAAASVSWQRIRPPPSKSSTTTSTGGLGV